MIVCCHAPGCCPLLTCSGQTSKQSGNACLRSVQRDPHPASDHSDQSLEECLQNRRYAAYSDAQAAFAAHHIATAAYSAVAPGATFQQTDAAAGTQNHAFVTGHIAAAGAGTRLASCAARRCLGRSGGRSRCGLAWSLMRLGCRTPVLYSRNQSRTNRVLLGEIGGVNLPSWSMCFWNGLG
jgi:hypothetical protein